MNFYNRSSAHREVANAEANSSVPLNFALMAGAFIGALLSIGYAYMKYVSGKQLPAKEGELKGIGALVYHRYYIDELYDMLFVKPVMMLSTIFYEFFDRIFIDGLVNFSGRHFGVLWRNQVRRLQSGYIGFYLFVMVLSIVGMFIWSFIITK